MRSTNLEQAQALADQGLIGGAELVQVNSDGLGVILNRGKFLGVYGLGAGVDVDLLSIELANPSSSSMDGNSLESVGSIPTSRTSVSKHGSSTTVDSSKSSETSDSA